MASSGRSGTSVVPRYLVLSGQVVTGNTNWGDTATNAPGSDLRQSAGNQDDAVWWDLYFAGGTWALDLFHNRSTNRGIFTVEIAPLDAAGSPGSYTSLGTIDSYNGAQVASRNALTGLAITAGHYRLRLRMATKNASSSGYFGAFGWLFLRLTTPT